MRTIILPFALLLTACNLAASLTGGSRTETFTPKYEYLGQTHSMTINFVIDNEVVTALTIESVAASDLERAHQLAFAANVRPHVLGKTLTEINIPKMGGDGERIGRVFREILEELKMKNEE